MEVAPAIMDRIAPTVGKAADDICNDMEKGETSTDISIGCESTPPVQNEQGHVPINRRQGQFYALPFVIAGIATGVHVTPLKTPLKEHDLCPKVMARL